MTHTSDPPNEAEYPKFGPVVFGSGLLQGTHGRDLLIADDNNATLEGDWGDDTLIGGDGNDFLDGGNIALEPHPDANILLGGAGNDTLLGSSANDTVVGGSGKDHLLSSDGENLLVGGSRADVFFFGHGAPATPGPMVGSNTVMDFSPSEGDKIDLSAMNYIGEINGMPPSDIPYKFIGTAPFSGKAAEVRFAHKDGDTLVMGDTRYPGHSPDGEEEFTITLQGIIQLQASDFVL